MKRKFIVDGQDGFCHDLQRPVCWLANTQFRGIDGHCQCDPGSPGNSATSRTKPATLETGLVIHVPEYLKEG